MFNNWLCYLIIKNVQFKIWGFREFFFEKSALEKTWWERMKIFKNKIGNE